MRRGYARAVIRSEHVFLQAAAFDVFQQGVKILLDPVIPHHVFNGLVVVNVVVMFYGLLRRNLNQTTLPPDSLK
jgi:hypothetical protein